MTAGGDGDDRRPEVVVSRRIAADPETVFAFFTDPDRFRRWLGVGAELDPRPDGAFRVQLTPRTVIRGRFVAVEAPRRVVFTWGLEVEEDAPDDFALPAGLAEVPPGSTTVEVTFEADGDGTVLTLRHRDLPTADAERLHGAQWALRLERVGIAATGGDPGPEPLVGAD